MHDRVNQSLSSIRQIGNWPSLSFNHQVYDQEPGALQMKFHLGFRHFESKTESVSNVTPTRNLWTNSPRFQNTQGREINSRCYDTPNNIHIHKNFLVHTYMILYFYTVCCNTNYYQLINILFILKIVRFFIIAVSF